MKWLILPTLFITATHGNMLFANNSFTLTDHISNDTLTNLDTVFQWGNIYQFDIVAEADIKNNTSNSITYNWVKVKTNINPSWDVAICDKNNCYIPSVTQQQFTLSAGEKGNLNAHFYPSGVDGEGTLTLKVVNISDNSDSAIIVYSASTYDQYNPVDAMFSYTINGTTIQFSDLSSNSPDSWTWTFGDGDSAFVQNPSHTYSSYGTYNVTLMVTNPISTDGYAESVELTYQPAIASFGYSVNDLVVTFNNSSTNATEWLWNFGDGDTSSLQNPSHTYPVADTYSVVLVVANLVNSDTLTKSIVVTGSSYYPVIAAFGYSVNNLAATFNDSSTNATGWFWKFGDGYSSFLQNPSHTYAVADTYNVELVVTNPVSTDTISQSVIVGTTGLFEIIELNNIRIYPNPSSGYLIIDGNSNSNELTLSVINQLGQEVYQISNTQINNLRIDLSHIENGIYLIKLSCEKSFVNKKLLLLKN